LSEKKEVAVELARVVGKAEAGKKLSAREILMLLPYYILADVDRKIEEARRKVESFKG
jgi:hypothetical protein